MPAPQKISLNSFFLSELEMALDDNSFLMSWYIDLQENTVTFISESFEQNEALVELIENDSQGERFIPIPPNTSQNGYAQMERFIEQVKEETVQQVLHKAIDGRGAFSRFRDALFDLGLDDDWYEFRDREERKNALDWLFKKGLIPEKDIQKGMHMFENDLARRKRRKANMSKMKKDAVVICSHNAGHISQITPGQTYEVLDEQKEQLNIRIKDDHGKIIWLPKSHFELVTKA